MALTAHTYPQFTQKMGTKVVSLNNVDSLKVMLLSAYTFANTHTTITDVKGAGTETFGTGYTAGGVALVTPSLATSALVTTLTTSTNPSWSTATFTASYAVWYDAQGGTDSTNYPFAYWDFGGAVPVTAATYTLTIAGGGICTWTAS